MSCKDVYSYQTKYTLPLELTLRVSSLLTVEGLTPISLEMRILLQPLFLPR